MHTNVTEKAAVGVVFIPWHFHEVEATKQSHAPCEHEIATLCFEGLALA